MKLPPLPRLDRGGESSLVLESPLEKIPEENPKKSVVVDVENGKGEEVDELLGIFDDLDEENLGDFPQSAKRLDVEAGSGGDSMPPNPENVGFGSKNGLLPSLKTWTSWKNVWVGCTKVFPVHFKICWMLFPPRSLLGKFVGLISNGFKGKKKGWNVISFRFGMPKTKGLSKCVAFKWTMSRPKTRGRFCKPPLCP